MMTATPVAAMAAAVAATAATAAAAATAPSTSLPLPLPTPPPPPPSLPWWWGGYYRPVNHSFLLQHNWNATAALARMGVTFEGGGESYVDLSPGQDESDYYYDYSSSSSSSSMPDLPDIVQTLQNSFHCGNGSATFEQLIRSGESKTLFMIVLTFFSSMQRMLLLL